MFTCLLCAPLNMYSPLRPRFVLSSSPLLAIYNPLDLLPRQLLHQPGHNPAPSQLPPLHALPPLIQHPHLLPQPRPHLGRQPHRILLVQLGPLAPPKHGPRLTLHLRQGRAVPRDDMEMDMGHDLGGGGAIILHDVVVGGIRSRSHGAGEEREERACFGPGGRRLDGARDID